MYFDGFLALAKATIPKIAKLAKTLLQAPKTKIVFFVAIFVDVYLYRANVTKIAKIYQT